MQECNLSIFCLVNIVFFLQIFHESQQLSDDEIRNISQLSDMTHFRTVLDEILIPRVVGTPNHLKVGNYIVNQMRGLGWDVTENVFADQTPVFGTLNFKNIIAKLNPNADRYLVLACHYDSKYMREHAFLGELLAYYFFILIKKSLNTMRLHKQTAMLA